jgi:hypothetical protein
MTELRLFPLADFGVKMHFVTYLTDQIESPNENRTTSFSSPVAPVTGPHVMKMTIAE